MAKKVFNTYKEACEFSKHIAITTKNTSAVHRDGDIWWVEDQNIVQSTSMLNKDEVKEESSNDGYILCPVNGYVKMVGGFWINRMGERVDTGKYEKTITLRQPPSRTITNTPTASYSYMDGDNHID